MSGSSLLQQKRRTRAQTLSTLSAEKSLRSLNSLRENRHQQGRKSVTANAQLHSNRNKFLTLLGISGIVAICGYLLFGPLLKIRSITCQTSTTEPCHDAAVAEFQQKLGAHILGVRFTDTVSKIQHAYPLYQKIHIKRILPDRVEISIEPSPVLYTIQIRDEKMNVNQAGILTNWLETSQQQPLMTIEDSTLSTLQVQQQLDSEYHKSLSHLHQLLKNTLFSYEMVIIKNLSEIHILTDKKTIIVGMDNVQNQLKIADKILTYPLEESWDIADLRFSKPILSNSLEIKESSISATPLFDF